MNPELGENATFLRYYEIWRTNPSSVVFAPLGELLILHRCYREAIIICKKGLAANPDLVSGRIALARAYIGVSNFKRAYEEAGIVLKRYPDHPEALEILKVSRVNAEAMIKKKEVVDFPSRGADDELTPSSLDPTEDVRWTTVTMADIFASQGDLSMARRIYNNVLEREPDNALAKEGLAKLSGIEDARSSQ